MSGAEIAVYRSFQTARVLALLALCACGAEDQARSEQDRATGVSGQGGLPLGGAGAAAGSSGGGAGLGGAGGGPAMAGAGAGGFSAGSGGAAGSAGTGGSAGAPVAGGMAGNGAAGSAGADPGMCPAAPAGASEKAILALMTVNKARVAAGAGCATMITEINTAAQNHCEYYASNSGMCTANPHNEVEGCTGFTGTSPGARMMAAGYTGRGASEVMAFTNDPERAIAMWINSVWHRIPVLDPWTTHLGYGSAERCDTIDFGRGTPAPEDTVVLYPHAGQTGVPTAFDGSREGPEPPAPPTGWPSASPITVYAQDLTVTEHVLTVDGQDAPIEHVWLTAADSNFLRTSVMMYANAPFAPNTTYRVQITGTYVGGPLELDWTFTTGTR